MKTQILDPDPENDSETCCKSCGDEYELREHSDPTKYCDLCAQKIVERVETELGELKTIVMKNMDAITCDQWQDRGGKKRHNADLSGAK